ncbi:MAG: heme exporter protein CcmB [Pseudomonadota bacterium]
MTPMRQAWYLIRRDCSAISQMIPNTGFLLIVVMLFSLSIGAESMQDQGLKTALMLVVVMLVCLIPQASIWQGDHDDGTLEWLISEGMPGWTLMLARALSHWLIHGWPACLLACLFATDFHRLPFAFFVFLCTTASLTLQGAMMSALLLKAKPVASLMVLMVLPLTVPVLIFASTALLNTGLPGSSSLGSSLSAQISTNLALLVACLCTSLVLCPYFGGLALSNAFKAG